VKGTKKEKDDIIPNTNGFKESTWVSFAYVGKETNFITELFRDTGVNISYRTNNTIEKFWPTDSTKQGKIQ
jgi:hypothetical protein